MDVLKKFHDMKIIVVRSDQKSHNTSWIATIDNETPLIYHFHPFSRLPSKIALHCTSVSSVLELGILRLQRLLAREGGRFCG